MNNNVDSYRCPFSILSVKNKPITAMVIGYIVEAAGFEPASKGPDTNVSTCVVYLKI